MLMLVPSKNLSRGGEQGRGKQGEGGGRDREHCVPRQVWEEVVEH